MVFKYIKKTDWGDYWVEENAINKQYLIERSFEIAAQIGLQLFELKNKSMFFSNPNLYNPEQ